MNYGFIGTGNMANAIIKGMVSQSFSPKDIFVYNIHMQKAEAFHQSYGVTCCSSTEEVIALSDILVLSVKPHVILEVIKTYKSQILQSKPIIVSIAAGISILQMEEILGTALPILRVMPNMNAKVQASTNGLCSNAAVSKEQKEAVESMFAACGTVTELPEEQFGIFSALAGSSPAFAYLYIDTLARAAQKAGLGRKEALQLSAQTALGSAKMILQATEHPWSLIDQVCSPGGTTIEGIAALQSGRWEACLTEAFDAVVSKEKQLKNPSSKN